MRRFFDEYRATFARYDVRELARMFVFPFQVVSDSDGVTPTAVQSHDEWLPILEQLLAAYRTLGVAVGELLDLEVIGLTPRLALARAEWELRREDGRAVYEFRAAYTLAQIEGAWRVAAIAHDEVPKLRAALAALAG